MLKIYYNEPGNKGTVLTVSDWHGIESLMKGHFEPLYPYQDDKTLICLYNPILDDKGIDQNIPVTKNRIIYGPAVWVRQSEHGFTSLTDNDIDILRTRF